MKIEIEKHTPLDGEYYLISIDGELYAKTWSENDSRIISESKRMFLLLRDLHRQGGFGINGHSRIKELLYKICHGVMI